MLLCWSCEFKLKPNEDEPANRVEVQRYDRLQSRYLTTGDFSALQQMNIEYPMQTRTLIEDVLQLGEVNDPEINSKYLKFYQDTLLQAIIADAEMQYASMDDINRSFDKAFARMEKLMPDAEIPEVYAQIGALDQSVVIGEKTIGISLDKYLGKDYPLYKRYYSEQQRSTMTRDNIVPDCLSFYLVSLFPMKNYANRSQLEKDLHMGKVMWVANKLMDTRFFNTRYVAMVDKYMKKNKEISARDMLLSDNYTLIQQAN